MKLPIGGCERSIRRAAQFTAAASATSAAVEPSAIRAPRLPQRRPSTWKRPESREIPLVGCSSGSIPTVQSLFIMADILPAASAAPPELNVKESLANTLFAHQLR